jgi:zinc transporter 5/7
VQVMSVEGVVSYSNPHFWKYSKNVIVGTIHIHISKEASQQKILQQVTAILKKTGKITELSVEISRVDEDNNSPTSPDDIIAIQYN